MKTLRGGNSVGYIRNGVLVGDSSSSCLRKVLLRSEGIQESVLSNQTQNVFALGHLSEKFFLESAKDFLGKYEVELKVIDNLIKDEVDFEGHSDVCSESTVYELKSVTSKNTYNKVFKHGQAKTENIIQLVNYMISLEKEDGLLVYTSYCDVLDYKTIGDLTWEQVELLANESSKEQKGFSVKILQDGTITVDGESIEVTISEILEFRTRAAEVLFNNTVYLDRPSSLKDSMFPPCYGCVCNQVCDEFESKRFTTEEFINKCKEII